MLQCICIQNHFKSALEHTAELHLCRYDWKIRQVKASAIASIKSVYQAQRYGVVYSNYIYIHLSVLSHLIFVCFNKIFNL